MNRDKFIYLFRPVIKRFGENAFNEDMLSLLFAKLILLDEDEIRQVVEDCLMEFTFTPSISKIITIAKPLIDQAYDRLKKEKMAYAEKHPCYMCDNSGWVETVDTMSTMRYTAAFRCICVVGKDFVGPKATTFWNEKIYSERFLASYKIKHSVGGGTRSELFDKGDKIAYERLGKVMGLPSDLKIDDVKMKFMELSFAEKEKALESVISCSYS